MLVCGYAGMLVCGYVGMLVCGYVGMLVCGYVSMLICSPGMLVFFLPRAVECWMLLSFAVSHSTLASFCREPH